MLVYYRFAGLVAVVALVVNMILLIGLDGVHPGHLLARRAWPAWH